ncbi:GNAT family N-acetyltransferase [Romboutsia maritimum]|uniref:GNAT family N-acetyltransferase n=1 Tax=Romboutsia maritimum TaxID=2020948 RepID=UPI001313E016|nr:GNAT family N-acetyltransferase [Romboutsia maritimum]
MLNLRKVTYEDCYLLFKWINDEAVRKNSFNSENIDIQEHKLWLKKKLQEENTKLYIILKDDCDVGVIRIEKNQEEYIISYSIAREFRGQKIGKQILIYIKEFMKGKKLVGLVKHDNIASIKAFEGAGYKKIIEKEYIKFVSI